MEVKMITVCGFSCGENCFLGDRCGGCESENNCCSYATILPGGVCPNLECVHKKGTKGCWECQELETCTVGFYGNDDLGAVYLAKSGAMFIRQYGETEFLRLISYILKEKKMRYTDYLEDKSSAEKLLESMVNIYMKECL